MATLFISILSPMLSFPDWVLKLSLLEQVPSPLEQDPQFAGGLGFDAADCGFGGAGIYWSTTPQLTLRGHPRGDFVPVESALFVRLLGFSV